MAHTRSDVKKKIVRYYQELGLCPCDVIKWINRELIMDKFELNHCPPDSSHHLRLLSRIQMLEIQKGVFEEGMKDLNRKTYQHQNQMAVI